MSPSVRHRSLRDRHGRGIRGPRFFPGTPARRTRRQMFDDIVASAVEEFTALWPAVSTIEFATEDVPPSDPVSWEPHSVVLAQIFPADRRRGLKDRIVVYRLPIMLRTHPHEVATTTRHIIAERISHILSIPPDELETILDS